MDLPQCLNHSIDCFVKCNDINDINDINDSCFVDLDDNVDSNNIFYILNHYLYDFSVLSLIFSCAAVFSCLFLSQCVYYPMIQKFKIELDKNRELYDTDAYLFEYLDEFYDLSENKLCDDFLESLKNKYIKQETPNGMRFNEL